MNKNREFWISLAVTAGFLLADALYRYGYNVGRQDERIRQNVLKEVDRVLAPWGTPDSVTECAVCGKRHPGAVPKL